MLAGAGKRLNTQKQLRQVMERCTCTRDERGHNIKKTHLLGHCTVNCIISKLMLYLQHVADAFFKFLGLAVLTTWRQVP